MASNIRILEVSGVSFNRRTPDEWSFHVPRFLSNHLYVLQQIEADHQCSFYPSKQCEPGKPGFDLAPQRLPWCFPFA